MSSSAPSPTSCAPPSPPSGLGGDAAHTGRPSDENYRKGLEIINNETARLYNMVEELLDFSRLQNGRLKMTCRPLDLVAELTDAVLFCEARIQREGLVLVYNEPEEMIPVYADPDRLRQVFINILDNAIKYSAPGGRITVKLWAGEYKAFIELIDQGRGIRPKTSRTSRPSSTRAATRCAAAASVWRWWTPS